MKIIRNFRYFKLSFTLIVFFVCCHVGSLLGQDYALVIVPVTDALVKTKKDLDLNQSNYNNLGCAIEKGDVGYYRAHQLLFNERVKVLEIKGEVLRVELLNAVYVNQQNNNTPCDFWCLKSHFLMLDKSNSEQIKAYIPEALLNKTQSERSNILILKEPWYEKMKQVWFSVGTNFVRDKSLDTDHEYCIVILNPNSFTIDKVLVPKDKIYTASGNTIQDRMYDFVNLLKSWCLSNKTTNIPYVWGGCSFVKGYEDKFKLISCGSQTLWKRDQENNSYFGFDCSGMILRAAQIVELPYWFKNTTTIKKNLKSLKPNEKLTEGDLLLYPGHVAVIADLKNNLIIESRGYSSGYGKVHMILVREMFKNIPTFDSLVKAYHQKRKLILLNKKGEEIGELSEFDILKI